MAQRERICLESRRYRRPGFDPQVGKIPWRRKRQPTPVFLPGEFHGQKSLVGDSPWDCKESDRTEWLTLSLSQSMPCGSLLTAPQVGGTGSLWVSTPAHVTWLIDKWYKSEYHEIKYVLINFKQEEQNHSYILFIYWLLGEGNDNPLQWSCLENPRDGGAWWAAVYGVAQSRTRLKRLSSSSLISSLLLLWISLLKMADSKKDLMSKYDRFLNKYLFWNKHLIISKSTRFIHKRHKWLQLLKESNKLMLMIEKSRRRTGVQGEK